MSPEYDRADTSRSHRLQDRDPRPQLPDAGPPARPLRLVSHTVTSPQERGVFLSAARAAPPQPAWLRVLLPPGTETCVKSHRREAPRMHRDEELRRHRARRDAGSGRAGREVCVPAVDSAARPTARSAPPSIAFKPEVSAEPGGARPGDRQGLSSGILELPSKPNTWLGKFLHTMADLQTLELRGSQMLRLEPLPEQLLSQGATAPLPGGLCRGRQPWSQRT